MRQRKVDVKVEESSVLGERLKFPFEFAKVIHVSL